MPLVYHGTATVLLYKWISVTHHAQRDIFRQKVFHGLVSTQISEDALRSHGTFEQDAQIPFNPEESERVNAPPGYRIGPLGTCERAVRGAESQSITSTTHELYSMHSCMRKHHARPLCHS